MRLTIGDKDKQVSLNIDHYKGFKALNELKAVGPNQVRVKRLIEDLFTEVMVLSDNDKKKEFYSAKVCFAVRALENLFEDA